MKTGAQEIRDVIDWVEETLERDFGVGLTWAFRDALQGQLDKLTQSAGEKAVRANNREIRRLLGGI